jgi:predicted GNAT superfamily acetyltransferase
LGRDSFGVPAVVREAAKQLDPSNPSLGCYVAVEEGTDRLVGVIVFTATTGSAAFIHAVGVVRDRRREGIATALKQQAIDYFGYVGVPTFHSTVDRFNTHMQNLNETKFGLVGEPDETGKDFIYASTVKIETDLSDNGN